MFITPTHAPWLPPPHAHASTGYNWSSAWAALLKMCVLCEINHFLCTLSMQCLSKPLIAILIFIISFSFFACFDVLASKRLFGTKKRCDQVNSVCSGVSSCLPVLWVCTVLLYLDKSWGSTSEMYFMLDLRLFISVSVLRSLRFLQDFNAVLYLCPRETWGRRYFVAVFHYEWRWFVARPFISAAAGDAASFPPCKPRLPDPVFARVCARVRAT